MTSFIDSPLPMFFELDGDPLDLGYVYIGAENQNPKIEANQIAVYWDEAGTIPAAQPLRTISGYFSRNGAPAKVFCSPAKYSIAVYEKTQNLIIYEPSASDRAESLRQELADTSDPTLGISLVGGAERVVDSIEALRDLPKTGGSTRVFVSGYYTAGDGDGGHYWYDPSDTTSADNGGTIIVATDGGRWKLISTVVSVKQFGAIATGATDTAAHFSAAAGAISEIHVPSGTYKLDSSPTATGTVVWVIHRGATFTGTGSLPGNIVSLSSAQPSWLSGAYNAAWAYMGQNAIAAYAQPGNLAFSAGGQTLGNNGATIGYSASVRNNAGTGFTGGAWCYYGTAVADNGGGGGSMQVMEMDIVSMSTNTGPTYGLAISAGGELAEQVAMGYVFQPVSAALLISQNNPQAYANCVFTNGIQIAENAIDATTKRAILMNGSALRISWQTFAGSDLGHITSSATTSAQSQSIDMSAFGTLIKNSAGQTVFQVNNNNTNNAANYLIVSSSSTGQVPQIAALGSDVDVDIQLTPKGAGVVWVGNHTAGVLAATGYITVKDSGGTVRRLLVG